MLLKRMQSTDETEVHVSCKTTKVAKLKVIEVTSRASEASVPGESGGASESGGSSEAGEPWAATSSLRPWMVFGFADKARHACTFQYV